MEWTKDRPTETGEYLRHNPSMARIARCFIVTIDGVLHICTGQGGPRRLDRYCDRAEWGWFGPLPLPYEVEEGHYNY